MPRWSLLLGFAAAVALLFWSQTSNQPMSDNARAAAKKRFMVAKSPMVAEDAGAREQPHTDAAPAELATDIDAAPTQTTRNRKPKRKPRRESSSSNATIAQPKAAATGFLSVSSKPWGAVYVNGETVAPETPAYRIKLTPGTHRVRIFFPTLDRFSKTKIVKITSGRTTRVGFRE